MSTWNAMTPEGKEAILRVVRHEARSDSGAIRGDRAIADRYLNICFRI